MTLATRAHAVRVGMGIATRTRPIHARSRARESPWHGACKRSNPRGVWYNGGAGRWSHGAMDGPARGCEGAGWHDPCNGSNPSQVWYKGTGDGSHGATVPREGTHGLA
jgi:hypothetical protein